MRGVLIGGVGFVLGIVAAVLAMMARQPATDTTWKIEKLDELCRLTRLSRLSDANALRSADREAREAAANRIRWDAMHHGESSVRLCLPDAPEPAEPHCGHDHYACLAQRAFADYQALEQRKDMFAR